MQCFVRVEDVEKRKELADWLNAIGYRVCCCCLFNGWNTLDCSIVDRINPTFEVHGIPDYDMDTMFGIEFFKAENAASANPHYDCGTNVELFKALAAMNDENDLDQWFVVKKAIFDVCGEFIYKRGDFYFNDSNQNIKYRRYLRKATADELVKYFRNIELKRGKKLYDMLTKQDPEYTLNDYQDCAMSTCMPSCDNFTYMLTELNAEVGEINDKIAKWRRKGIASIKDNRLVFSTSSLDKAKEYQTELAFELGDALWAIAGLAHDLRFSLEEIGQMNIRKLADRKKRGVIDGTGDKR